ncbi:MAG TPA: hypothetical protein VKO18_04705 [Terriglobia bacterium]|nr:hypothetical protein [Terriglobia bacterium]
MIRIQWFRGLRSAAYLVATALLLAVMNKPAVAQDIVDIEQDWWLDANGDEISTEGFAEILGSTDQAEIDTYVATNTTYSGEWYWGETYVEGDLYRDDQQVDSQWAVDDGAGNAAVSMTDSLEAGHWYELDGYHEVEYDEYCIDDEDDGCSGYYDLTTEVEVYTGVPVISTIDPTGAGLGTSGSIDVTGDNLVDPFTCEATPAITGSGISLSVGSIDLTEEGGDSCGASALTLNYSISANATTGAQTLTLSNRFGASNGVTFTVDDPTPTISSITPNPWQAGWTNRQVTITGTGFGTSPTVTVSDPNANCTVTSATDPGPPGTATILGNCSVAANDLNTSATVTVTSHGYGGIGFIGVQGQPSSANDGVGITPYQPPAPQIFLGPDNNGSVCNGNATNITNQTVNALVGQSISFTACIPSSVPINLVTQTVWSPAGLQLPFAIANFSVAATPANCGPGQGQTLCSYTATQTPVSNTTCTTYTYCDFNAFFFVTPGSYTFVYSYAVSNGLYASASVTYVAAGPTNVEVSIDPVFGPGTGFTPVSIWADSQNNAWMGLGMVNASGSPPYGIWLSPSYTPPVPIPGNPGSLLWVQVFTSQTWRMLNNYGTWTGHLSGQVSPTGEIYSAVLDTVYPYPYNGNYWFDDPDTGLLSSYSELSENYSSTVYLMWDPTIPPAGKTCSAATTSGSGSATIGIPSTCASIPVPLGYVTWGACGDAANTLGSVPSTGTDWALNCSSETAPSSFVPSTTYPSWQSTLNGAQLFKWSQP